MKYRTISMKEVVERDYPDFVIQYQLFDGQALCHFPGSLLNFSYKKEATLNDIYFDVFPEFNIGGKILDPYAKIPQKGEADMYIVSDKHKDSHRASLYEDRKCFLFKGEKLVGEAVITKVYKENRKVH